MRYTRFTPGRRLLASAMQAIGVAAAVLVALVPNPAQAGSHQPSSQGYLGRWNYDQPDRATNTNIAVVSCPASVPTCVGEPPFEVPQIGDIVFTAGADGAVVGHTDQGCTWTFAV